MVIAITQTPITVNPKMQTHLGQGRSVLILGGPPKVDTHVSGLIVLITEGYSQLTVVFSY